MGTLFELHLSLLLELQSFTEIADLAATGDHTKVDTMSADLQKKDEPVNLEVNAYSCMPDFQLMFSLGKAAESTYDGMSVGNWLAW